MTLNDLNAIGDTVKTATEVELSRMAAVSWMASATEAGYFTMALDFSYVGNDVLPLKLALKIDGEYPFYEARQLHLPIAWEVENDVWQEHVVQDRFLLLTDRYGNELQPQSQIRRERQTTPLYDSSYYHVDPIVVKLDATMREFTLESLSDGILLHGITFVPVSSVPTYEAYSAMHASATLAQTPILLEAEFYASKSDPSVKLGFDSNPASSPYSTYEKRLNTIDGYTFNTPGQSVTIAFEVPESGLYPISFKALQNTMIGLANYRKVMVDGVVPFSECQTVAIPYDLDWQWVTIESAGAPALFYLSEGTHTLTLQVSIDPYRDVIETMQSLMKDMNRLALEVKKLTAGMSQDTDRDYEIMTLIPDLETRLLEYRETIEAMLRYVNTLAGNDSTAPDTKNWALAIKRLDWLIESPNRIATSLTTFSEGSSSAAQLLGAQILKLTSSPVGFEKIQIGDLDQRPAPNASFWRIAWEELKKFFRSFDKNTYATTTQTVETVDVWVNRPRVYVELMQQMIDQEFTPETGIEVNLSLMPSTNKLILANAAGKQPDLAMGVSSKTIYEFALRDAAIDFRDFPGYAEIVSHVSKGVMIPYVYGDGVYGLPETQSFYLTYLRTDLLDSIGLPDVSVETWDDVKDLLPELQSYGMNFYIPLAGESAYKSFAVTLPFFEQMNVPLFSEDASSVNIASEDGIRAMRLMTELFNTYALPKQVPSFYNHFRYGTLPIGVSNDENYVKLLIAAPEIKNNWRLALYPGVKDPETGEVNHAAPSSSSGLMMFHTETDQNDTFELVKWWLSTETQAKFAFDLQTMYGKEFIWFTANVDAFQSLAIPEEHKQLILEQWGWAVEAPNVPGSYMLEREISNVWNKVALGNANLRDELEQAAILSNRELFRKLEEFGYVENGVFVKPYLVPTKDNIDDWLKERNEP
jgi:ABC-type glycerol-3-phosphate transport system substrate-binding protein